MDERLNFSQYSNIDKIEGGPWFLEKIWSPSLHIPNNVEPGLLQRNDHGPLLVRIHNNGSVLFTRR